MTIDGNEVKEHKQTKHEEVCYYCDHCRYMNTDRNKVRIHKQTKHDTV